MRLRLGALLGALVLTAVAVLALTDSRTVVFRSGSMAPTIPTGAIAVVHEVPAAELRLGDVVTVPSRGTFVTHRIVAINPDETLQLQGDANPTPDAEPYRVRTAERVVASVPWAGYLVAALTGPAGLLLAAAYAVWLFGGAPRPTHRAVPRPRRRRLGTVAVLATVVSLAVAPRAWSAPWSDTAAVDGTSLSSATVPAPANFRCDGVGLGTVTFAWDAVPGATSYTVYSGEGAELATVTGTSARPSGLSGRGTAYVRAHVAYGATTWTSGASATRSWTVVILGTCR